MLTGEEACSTVVYGLFISNQATRFHYIYIYIYMVIKKHIYIYIYIHISISGLYYYSHPIYLFFQQIPNTIIDFLRSVRIFHVCSLKSRYHCIATESGCFCGVPILHEETLRLTFEFFFFLVGIVSIACFTNSTSCHNVVTYRFLFGG